MLPFIEFISIFLHYVKHFLSTFSLKPHRISTGEALLCPHLRMEKWRFESWQDALKFLQAGRVEPRFEHRSDDYRAYAQWTHSNFPT